MEYPKLIVVTVQQILDGACLNIPALEVTKKAEHKGKEIKNQPSLGEEFEKTSGDGLLDI